MAKYLEFEKKIRDQQKALSSGKEAESLFATLRPIGYSGREIGVAPEKKQTYSVGQNLGRYSLDALSMLNKVLTAGQAGMQVVAGQIGGSVSAAVPSLRREIGGGSALEAYRKTSRQAMDIARETLKTGSYSEAMRQTGYNPIDKYSRNRVATDIITDVALDPFTYVGAGLITKPLKEAATAVKLVAEGEKVTGTVKTGIRAAQTARERQALSNLVKGITSEGTAELTKQTGSLAAFANRNAEIIKKIYGIGKSVAKLGRKEVGMVDEAVGLINKDFVAKLKGAKEMDRFADNVQRNILAEGRRITPETVREEVVRIMRSSEMLNKTPDEMLKQFQAYSRLDIALGKNKSLNGLALAKDVSTNKTPSIAVEEIEKAIEERGKFEYSLSYGPTQRTFEITKKDINKLKEIAERAKEAGYKVVYAPGKSDVLEPTTRGFIGEGFVRTREKYFMPQKTKLETTPVGKFLTGSKITENTMSAAVENNTFNKLSNAFGSEQARNAMKGMKELINAKNEALAVAKGVDVIKLLTLGEGIAGPSRFMDLNFSDIAKVAKSLGLDANQLWRATKEGFMFDWSLAGVQNIGAFLRSRSKIVDYISRLKNDLKFSYSPMFHAQQHTEVAMMNLLLGKSDVADDDILKYFSKNFDVVSGGAPKGADVVEEAIEDIRTRSYDRKYIEKQGNHFFREIFDRELQGTGIKDWKTAKKELDDIFEGRQVAEPKYNGEGDFLGFNIKRGDKTRTKEEFLQEVSEYATERNLNFTQAFLDLHPEAQPIISAVQNAMRTSEMMMRGMTQMSYIRGGLERSANYIFFPTSYVVRSVKTLAHIASRPKGYITLKVVNEAKKKASDYLKEKYGEEVELMPNVSWMLTQFIPLGLDNVGASLDPLARYIMVNLGLGDYVKAPKSLAKSYVPIYRNAIEFNDAMGEIKESIEKGELKTTNYASKTGGKVYMDKALYDFVTQAIPFNVKKMSPNQATMDKIKKAPKGKAKPTTIPRVSEQDRMRKIEEVSNKIIGM